MELIRQIEHRPMNDDQLSIYFIGQSGYVIKTRDCTLYIDPYLSDYIENPIGLNDPYMMRNYPPPFLPSEIQKLDAVICTHAHVDHMDPWTLNQIRQNFCFYVSDGAYEKSAFQLDLSKITFLVPQETYEFPPFTIMPIPAAHYELTDEKGRPDCLSILIQWKEKTLFFWGDGIVYDGQIDLLSQFKFNYFFAPINGRDPNREERGIIGNINGDELIALCSNLSIEYIIPNHYDMFKNNTGSVASFQRELKQRNPNQSIVIMKCGDKIEL